MGILLHPRTTLTSIEDKVGMARNIICAWQSVRPHKHLFLFADSVRNITLETQLHQEAPIWKQSVDGQVSIWYKIVQLAVNLLHNIHQLQEKSV